jgi:hypothetical protein
MISSDMSSRVGVISYTANQWTIFDVENSLGFQILQFEYFLIVLASSISINYMSSIRRSFLPSVTGILHRVSELLSGSRCQKII